MWQNLNRILLRNAVRSYATPATKLKTRPSQKKNSGSLPLISCKRSNLDLLVPAPENSKFGTVPLASKGWMHYKSKSDQFTLNATVSDEQMQAEMQNLDDFLSGSSTTIYPELLENLKTELGITQLTSIQQSGIPKIYNSEHALVAAETGCGKTLSYMLPIVQKILERKRQASPNAAINDRRMNTPLAVILTPGRELASQIGSVTESLCQSTELQVKTILGGNTKRLMLNPEFADIDILVATMGALSKLVTTGIYRMDEVRHVVLDEADTLLDDTFSDKLCHFLKRFPFHKNHTQNENTVGTQLILASATMPTNTEALLKRIIDIQTLHQVVSPNLHRLMPHVEQRFVRMAKADRPANLLGIVKRELAKNRPIIVFSNKSASCDYTSIFLNNHGVKCLNLNGDMLMKIRLGRFEQFQSGECDVLSTTDVSSRGLDTTRARHVINFDFPLHVSDYIHRCGRIGRVGNRAKSLVTNFISSRREVEVVQRIEHAARTGGLLPDVNANISNIINKRIMHDMHAAGLEVPQSQAQEEEF